MGSVIELCDWKKEMIAARFAELRAIVSEPRFVCRKCARVANDGKWLCKPQDLGPVGPGRPGSNEDTATR